MLLLLVDTNSFHQEIPEHFKGCSVSSPRVWNNVVRTKFKKSAALQKSVATDHDFLVDFLGKSTEFGGKSEPADSSEFHRKSSNSTDLLKVGISLDHGKLPKSL
jgi:hypothetical protein